ncbi:Hypothetical protein RMHFA_00758 [Roseomonas mucosa]|uniref:DUF3597 domain-containing protein n=1 Tax=Roseomonas TaxID=125216 RepID=UPI00096493E6|nr:MULTISPECIES: DUF3597 domain-containing protein [Roseomonas]ATR21792.1 DUF3597 domain-containing protein [Roseomonas sp. FDAARGOS_362]MDU7520735.1 DUF3597 domain-containing protein [Roseomonas mucosa]USQ70031.1 DUF3597 domain-containing protein [Roseomonas mucosa]UZO95767.1 Hypothetical protein RMHFA_00758 [Roseomonas mucosa]GAV36203.1 hypothetical protein ROTAS13_03890 [Roseomonas sp. TAS13]
MSIFSSILNKIFHPAGAAQAATPAGSDQAPDAGAAPAAAAPAGVAPAGAAPAGAGSVQSSGQEVDVESVLEGIAAQKGGGGNWRTSIVDLLKMLDLDSSLDARKQLASELNVHAGADGSAEQNIALSKAVWQQLAQNGGKVPDSLKH